MAEEKKDVKKARQDEIKSLEANLSNSFYLSLIGVDELTKADGIYGQLGGAIGKNLYAGVLTGKEATEARNQAYQKELQARKSLGIGAMPEYTSNYQLIKYSTELIAEAASDLPLGSLETILGKIDSGIKFKVPEELKRYEEQKENIILNGAEDGKSREQIAQMLESSADEVSEKAIKELKGRVYGLVRHAAAVKIIKEHAYDNVNADIANIAKGYRKAKGIPEPEDKKKTA